MKNNQCITPLKDVKDVVSYSETEVGQNNEVKIIIKNNENESSELVVERFSNEEIDIINLVLKKIKEKLYQINHQNNVILK